MSVTMSRSGRQTGQKVECIEPSPEHSWGYRRAVNDALLVEVASIVKTHPRNPRPVIAKQLNTSTRNASRWISAAKSAGFLTEKAAPDAVTRDDPEG